MTPVLSIVVPVHNEAESLPELLRRIDASVRAGFPEYEVILVDDGSTDESWSVIRNAASHHSSVRGIRLSRNMGEHIAVSAGLDAASGERVVLMDADLQDLPEHIPVLAAELGHGYDMVYAIRKHRQHGVLKRWTSSFFWMLLRRLTGLDIPPDQATLRIMTKRFRDALVSLPESNRFIYGLTAVIGFPQKAVELEHGKRFAGRSNYNPMKLLLLAATGVTALSSFPLRLAFFVGLFLTATSSIFAVEILVQKLVFNSVSEGWTSLMVAIIFMGGVQMTMIGILGVYMGKNYMESKHRPLYFISDRT
jgi:dolichol-phosphate mannosyltransferase